MTESGAVARTRRLSERVRVVLAPNASPMTLEGTNTYVVGGEREVIVIDPGPDDPAHFDRVLAAAGPAEIVGVFLTHWHSDHSEGARSFAGRARAPIGSWSPMTSGEPLEIPLHDGERAGAGEIHLTAIHTPGHASDHMSFWLDDERALFTGDHILGRGTTVVAYPDGDMNAYMRSLRIVQDRAAARLYPGHGPVVDDPAAVVAEYIEHRLMRERQVIAALPGSVDEIVARIYHGVDPILHPVAAMSVRAHLAKLSADGLAAEDGADRWRSA